MAREGKAVPLAEIIRLLDMLDGMGKWTLGRPLRVHFAHQRGGDVHHVVSVRNGTGAWMVTLADFPGEFAAHLFVDAKEEG